MMQEFKSMVNDCIRIGLRTNTSSLKRLSVYAYAELRQKYSSIPSYYRLTAISKAAGILASRKKSMRRGIPTKDPYLAKLLLVSCYQFKIINGFLVFPTKKDSRELRIPLTKRTLQAIKENDDVRVRSFTITPNSLSISISKEMAIYFPKNFLGIDRNASNVTCGNNTLAVKFDVRKIEEIAKTTRQILGSFTRNDVRIRMLLASKYGRRRSERVKQILHRVSKEVVDLAQVN